MKMQGFGGALMALSALQILAWAVRRFLDSGSADPAVLSIGKAAASRSMGIPARFDYTRRNFVSRRPKLRARQKVRSRNLVKVSADPERNGVSGLAA
jgi:hypothetical protein